MINKRELRNGQPDFETQKRKYFIALGLKIREAIKLHQAFGLLDKARDQRGKVVQNKGVRKEIEWRNASEHQLVVAARSRALSRLFGLSEETINDLTLAAGMHDFYKKRTIEKTPREVSLSMQNQIDTEKAALEELTKIQFPQNIIDYTASVGSSPKTIRKVQDILSKGESASEQEIAELVIHYVDDFTIDSGWANPAEVNEQGKKINDLNRRIQKARDNPKYSGVDQGGREYFNGETTLNTQEAVGEQVEILLAQKLSAITGGTIDPKDLPMLIDEEIKKAIARTEA